MLLIYKILTVCIDNIMIIGNDDKEIKMLKIKLAKKFKIKDLDNYRYLLRIEATKSNKGI